MHKLLLLLPILLLSACSQHTTRGINVSSYDNNNASTYSLEALDRQIPKKSRPVICWLLIH